MNALTPTPEKDVPKVLDPDDLGMHVLPSGVRASSVGEDGDVMLMGHHDDLTAWSLFVQFQTYEQGSCDLTADDREVYSIERRYAAFSDHSEGCDLHDCTCDDQACEHCRVGAHDACDDDACDCAGEFDHDFEGPWPCSCECWCDEYAWWVSETKSGHEVTWVRFSFEKFKARRDRNEARAATPLSPAVTAHERAVSGSNRSHESGPPSPESDLARRHALDCKTCNGWNPVSGVRRRETVGMVCQACGWDYAANGEPPTPLPPATDQGASDV